MTLKQIFPLLGLLLLAGCTTPQTNANSAEPESRTSQNQNSTTDSAASTQTASPQTEATLPDRLVPTESFTPEPIQIALSDLPQPYASQSARKSPNVIPIPENPTLQVPEGFVVNVFAENLDRPRWLALTPEGDVLVTETRQNRIRLLSDRNNDGVAEVKETFADAGNGLNIPFGMAFAEGYFFLGNTDAVLRFPYAAGQQQLSDQGEKIADLPGGGYNQHWTRNVVVSPDAQKLFVSVGSRSNVSEEPLPRASVQVMNLDGSDQQTFASGLRNPVGLDFHPITGNLYTTVNERDGLGDDLVPDYLTQIQSGEFFGWPYAYLTPNNLDPRQTQGDRSRDPQKAAQTKTPDVLFQSHSAALGLQFYDSNTFPESYRNGAFVAMRGSWNRSQGTGYKVVYVPFEENRPVGYYEDFLKGFLVNPSGPDTWGRPVGLIALPDGSLLVTEEMNNRIYRIQYVGS
ncbi:sorbosone dehydrogenase family protein [Sphaerothrix gracilis]|uniref:PQQ-dependent sugar dehydrogenase n=1 Tax=Sphaerothrix gracilis TaxID=3151835 RepID=UPI0031FE08C1